MLTRDEAPASPKLAGLLRKRLRQLMRALLVLAVCLAVAGGGFAIWRVTSLNGLPDIGEPFDVAAFRAHRVPDEHNAFTFLQRADEALTASPSSPEVFWSQADPKLRGWVEANRQALDLFLQGAEQTDAALPEEPMVDGCRLMGLVLLEASKRQERGDTAGAWDYHRAVLRMRSHMRRRGSLRQRYDVNGGNAWLQQSLNAWASDPRTTISQLRAALEEVLKNEPQPDWDSFALKSGYLEMMRALERPIPTRTQEELGGESSFRIGDMALSANMVASLEAMSRFALREPERSRRVLRLLCANYLAHIETAEPRTRKPAAWAVFSVLTSTNPIRTGTISLPLYAAGPDAPAGARALAARELASWLVATHDARLRVLWSNSSDWPWPPDRLVQRRAHGALVIMLATELYRRERGALPTSDEALIGTYLETLPDNESGEFDDLSAAIVQ